jgi:hypothetical protein
MTQPPPLHPQRRALVSSKTRLLVALVFLFAAFIMPYYMYYGTLSLQRARLWVPASACSEFSMNVPTWFSALCLALSARAGRCPRHGPHSMRRAICAASNVLRLSSQPYAPVSAPRPRRCLGAAPSARTVIALVATRQHAPTVAPLGHPLMCLCAAIASILFCTCVCARMSAS